MTSLICAVFIPGQIGRLNTVFASSSAMGLTNGAATIRSASVGTKQGFSIVAYNSTGSSLTLDHGLSQKPDFF